MSMPRAGRSIAALGIVAMLGTATCDGSGGGFAEEDLDAIVLTPVDAPEGTTYSRAVSGFQDLTGFARNADEKEALVVDGFIAGHLALFAPDGASEPGEGAALPQDAPFAQGITGLFDDDDGASRALGRFLEDLQTRQLDTATVVEALEVGDESYAFEGDAAGSNVLMYAWRDRNLIVVVGGAGSMPADEVRALAMAVQDRAMGAS